MTRLRSGAPKSSAVRAVMLGNRRRDTRPELRLRSELHRAGCRYRVDYRIEGVGAATRADVAFTRARVAVFVDGCFWHRCPNHGINPRHNSSYWAEKLDRNVVRDRAATAALTAAGWHVVRVWEHTPVSEAVTAVLDALESARAKTSL